MLTDEDLAVMSANGDEGSFAVLVERYLRPVFSFVYRYTESSEAEDITQDVFIRAWRSIESFDSKKRFKTWLFAIAKNAAFDWLKKKRPHAFSDFDTEEGDNPIEDTVSDSSQDPRDLMNRIDSHDAVQLALAVINPEDRALVLLRARDELSFEEISEILDRPLNTVKSRYRRALIKMRDKLMHQSG